jgi:hypothetical protein
VSLLADIVIATKYKKCPRTVLVDIKQRKRLSALDEIYFT